MVYCGKGDGTAMTYQKPMNPQRFDEPVYEQMNPKAKAEKKRPVAIRQQQVEAVAPAKRRKAAVLAVKPGAKPISRPL